MASVLLGVLSLALLSTYPACGCSQSPDHLYSGTRVNCSYCNLARVPNYLPGNTTVLDISHNNISFIDKTSLPLPHLRYLDASFSNISKLGVDAFHETTNLRVLLMAGNKLSYADYPEEVFLPLQRLQKINLHNNDGHSQGTYPKAFGKLRSVQEISLDTFEVTKFDQIFANMTNLTTLLLGFRGCKLKYLKNDTFSNFSKAPIATVNLDHCPLVDIESNAFSHLVSMRFLNMSYSGYLPPTTAVKSMYGLKGRNLSTVTMDGAFDGYGLTWLGIEHQIFSESIVNILNDVCVASFSLKRNRIVWIDKNLCLSGTFCECIRCLDLSENYIFGSPKLFLMMSLTPNIISLKITKVAWNELGVQRQNLGQPGIDNLRKTLHRQVQNRGQSTLYIYLPKSLRYLYVPAIMSAPVQLHQLNVMFVNASSLEYVNFAYNGFNEFQNILGLANLPQLDISGNPLGGILNNSFDNLTGLTYLDMTNSDLGNPKHYLLENGRGLLRPLRRLRSIVLANNNLVSLDKHMFADKPLEKIDLSRNRFRSIPFDLTSTPYLCNLDLSYNSVVDVSNIEMTLLDDLASNNNLTLNLSANLLSCGCHNLDFILWLSNTNVTLVPSRTYDCLQDDGTFDNTSHYAENYEKIWRTCYGRLLLAGTVSGFAMTILTMAGMYIIVVRKTLLVNIVLRLFGYRTTARPLRRFDFPNDAYLGYSDVDYQHVCHTVRELLEDRHGVKLFLKDRDTIPGGQIADDIISGIDSSWKTVLIVTQSFVEDQWCRFIVNRVVYSSSRMPVGSIVLVLFEDVRRGDISPALLNVVEERYIFSVGRYRGDEGRLWEEVSQYIKLNTEVQ